MTKTPSEVEGSLRQARPLAGRALVARLDRLRRPSHLFDERRAALWAAGVSLYLVAAWVLVQRVLVSWLSNRPALDFYLIQPVLWLGLAAFAYTGWRRLGQRPPFTRVLTGIAALLGAFHVALFVFGGIVFGFGDSFVAGQLANYPRNFWFVATWMLGLETARAFLLHAWRPFSRSGAFWVTATLLACAMTPYGRIARVTQTETLAGFIVPTVMLSILLTWLVEHGGLGPSMSYWGFLLAFEWFSQVQPDLDWPVLLLIGMGGPMLSARFIRNIYLDTREGAMRWNQDDIREDDRVEPRRHSRASTTIFTIVLLTAVVVAGVLGYRPAVVGGISMEPAYRKGDVAIVDHSIDPDSLAVGDVVQYRDSSGRSIVHRIVLIEEGLDGPVFTTKGDNNPTPDDSFSADAVEGKIVFLVPGLGWPVIWLRGV